MEYILKFSCEIFSKHLSNFFLLKMFRTSVLDEPKIFFKSALSAQKDSITVSKTKFIV